MRSVIGCRLLQYFLKGGGKNPLSYCLLFIVHEVNEVRQTEIHILVPLVPDRSAFGFELVI